ncbi:8-oxo-dGTP diphosphatase MutT [Marinicella sp. S1101]|uniref:8-oxo-dGTP diphosphatase MutT n=1 Tax=Marinicella marina TaxID=2996016 RepID=UPI002260FD7C|nr:8-oxo-dGTP diphosphatase MutT [Marinicella marina]MCX7554572.1 8-oxo-dGTP diphosphatase MutT [Marinicella marina]MDJ1141044.1 8-oxo-dGTP diphosphatase MutT [Marinicella marina]
MPRSLDLSKGPVIEVVVLVLENHQGDVLITQRKADAHLANYWEFPGGKVESGENLSQALKRECIEEIDHAPNRVEHILTLNHEYPSRTVRIQVFHEISTHPKVKPIESQSMKWVPFDELQHHQLPPANTPILEYLHKRNKNQNHQTN